MKLALLIACYLIFWGIVLSGCKTRKVEKERTNVVKEQSTKENTEVKKDIESTTQDKSTEKTESKTETKTTSKGSVKLQADSIVTTTNARTGEKKTKVYPSKGSFIDYNIDQETNEAAQEVINKQTDLLQQNKSEIDSAVNKESYSKQDSTKKTNKTDAEGSGKTWGRTWAILSFLALCLGGFLLYKKFK